MEAWSCDFIPTVLRRLIDEGKAIPEAIAILLAIFFTILFVAPFYLSPTLRSTPLNHRDSPDNIRARVRAVGLTCLASALVTVAVLHIYCHVSISAILHLTGLFPFDPLDIARALLLVLILFVGPLYESLYIDSGWQELNVSSFKYQFWDTWTGLRNHTIAPAGEEFVFRSLVIALWLQAGISGKRIVFQSPLVFGVAHVHHLVEFLQHRTPKGQRWPGIRILGIGLLRSIFQFAYTSLFGFFAAFVFLRTGSLYAAIVVHSFCNFMGFPRVGGKVGRYDNGKSIGWSVAYYILLSAGALGFYTCLWAMTQSSNSLTAF